MNDDTQMELLRLKGLVHDSKLTLEDMDSIKAKPKECLTLADFGRELKEAGDRLLQMDTTNEEIKLKNEKPVGYPPNDMKSFYLDTVVSTSCPQCGHTCQQDLSLYPISYPEYNKPFTWISFCTNCLHEWRSESQLILHVELQAVPRKEQNYDPDVSESNRTIS